ncbi:MAG: TonB-dependent receptor [Alphaproteobacteria bacterium]|nr:TonB-dependent receptor [Alphaproteobacteria bacterium]
MSSSSFARRVAASASLAVLSATLAPSIALAETVDAEDRRPEAEIVVVGQRPNPEAEAATQAARERPGNVSVVAAEEFEDRYAVTFRDTLQLTPGVIAQPRFGEEVRLSIRGSGLANNAHLRGAELLFDGVPINGADGFGDFQELDPTFANFITVNRGANAFASGSATLGGAIELTGITGRSVDEAGFLRLDVGAFGTERVNARAAYADDRYDLIVAATGQRQDGFRQNAEQSNGRLYSQAGIRWNDAVETRFGILANDVNQRIPGALTIAQATTTPELANTGNFNFAFARDINSWRGWTRTTIDAGAFGDFTLGAAYTDRQLYHPISVVIDQRVSDGLLFARWDGETDALGVPLAWTAGVRWRDARTAARTYAATPNRQAARGALTAHSIQYAGGLDAFAELRLEPTERLTLLAGLNSIDTDREVLNLRNPAASDSEAFNQISPKLGVLWEASSALQIFANVSGVYEPPSFGQLTQGGFVTFVPIKAQEGTSYEIGVRGDLGRVRYELTYYDARLNNEFISFQVSPLIPAATFNAPNTIHRGIEAGLGATLAEDLFGGALNARAAWTWNDFTFDGDPVYGDNWLAGVPERTLVAELSWSDGRLRITPSVFVQSDTVVDFRNTLRAPGYTLFNISGSYAVTDSVSVFLEGRNLTDEKYVSMVSSIANAQAPGVNLSIATPGDGAAVFGGLRLRFGARS